MSGAGSGGAGSGGAGSGGAGSGGTGEGGTGEGGARDAGRRRAEREDFFTRWSALHGGYDPRGTRWVEPWLTLTHALARPLARARVDPDLVTLGGLGVSAAVPALAWAGGRWTLLAAPVAVVAALLDGLDGAVAVLQERVTPWGAVLDAVADRLSDLLFLGALGVAGAPVALCAAGAVPMFLLEYLRARATIAGMTEIGTVTVWERATRVVVTTTFLLGAGLYVGQARRWASLGAAAWVGLGVTGCAQLARVVRQRLR